MKIRLWHVYREEANGDGGDAGAGAGADGIVTGDGGDPNSNPGSQNYGDNWRDALPSELQESASLKDVKDIGSLAQQFVDLQSHLGNSIRVPSEHASQEDRAKFYEKLQKHAPDLLPRPDRNDTDAMDAFYASMGRPEEASGYEKPEIPEGVNVPDERIQAFQEIAHKHGLNAEQFKGVLGEVLAADQAAYQQQMDGHNQAMDGLKQEWGAAFDDRNGRAVKMLEATGAPADIVQMAKDGMVGANTLKWMYDLSTKFGGEGAPAVQDQGASGRMTPAEAEAQISEIMNNRQHPYWDSHHPEHQSAIKKMLELGKFANPKASTDINDLRSSISISSS